MQTVKIFKKKYKNIAHSVSAPYEIINEQNVTRYRNNQRGYICMDISHSKIILDIHYAARDRIFNLMHQGRKRIWF